MKRLFGRILVPLFVLTYIVPVKAMLVPANMSDDAYEMVLGVKERSFLLQRYIVNLVRDLKQWSYGRIFATAVGIAVGYEWTGNIYTQRLSLMQIVQNPLDATAFAYFVGAPFWSAWMDRQHVRKAQANINTQVTGLLLHQQIQAIQPAIQNWMNQQDFMIRPLQPKVVTAAKDDVVERIAQQAIAHAQDLPMQKKQIKAVDNFYSSNNLQKNDELPNRAYHKALDALGISLGRGLGAFATHVGSVNMAWRNSSFRGFADYMQTPGMTITYLGDDVKK